MKRKRKKYQFLLSKRPFLFLLKKNRLFLESFTFILQTSLVLFHLEEHFFSSYFIFLVASVPCSLKNASQSFVQHSPFCFSLWRFSVLLWKMFIVLKEAPYKTCDLFLQNVHSRFLKKMILRFSLKNVPSPFAPYKTFLIYPYKTFFDLSP